MGLATIDPHSHKEQTKLYKISNFGVNRLNSKQDTAIENVKMKCMPIWTLSEHSVRMAIHFFVNFGVFKYFISVKTSLITPNLGIM